MLPDIFVWRWWLPGTRTERWTGTPLYNRGGRYLWRIWTKFLSMRFLAVYILRYIGNCSDPFNFNSKVKVKLSGVICRWVSFVALSVCDLSEKFHLGGTNKSLKPKLLAPFLFIIHTYVNLYQTNGRPHRGVVSLIPCWCVIGPCWWGVQRAWLGLGVGLDEGCYL